MKELYSENLDTVKGAMEDVFRSELAFKSEWSKQARKCVAFANGDQLSDHAVGSGISVNNQPPARKDERNPKGYVGNEIEPIKRTLISHMTRAKPGVDITSLGRDDDSKNTAKISQKIIDAKYDLDCELDNSILAADWALTTGTTFSKDFWDSTLGDYIAEIDPATGNPIVDPETGAKIYSKKAGNNSVAMLSGLSVTVDHSVTDPRRLPYIGDSYVTDVDWAREAFDRKEPGYTGNLGNIKEDNNLSDSMQILETMKFSVPYLSKGIGEKSKGKTLIREMFLMPNKDFQKGRQIIMAGPEIVFITDAKEGSPYFMELENTEWHPYDIYRYELYLGRFLGKGLVEQLIPLQMRLNEINKAILVNANTVARPRLMCTSDQIPAGTLAGDKNIIRYASIPNVREPYMLQGAPLPQQFFNERQMIIDEMVRIAGTNFVMQGQPPTGVTAGSAIAQLLENANTQHSGSMAAWEKFHERRYTKKLRILHKFNKYPDQQLNRYVKTLVKDALDTQVHDFVGQIDLSDGVILKIQAGSMNPKSDAAKKDLYRDFAGKGLLGPVGEDSPRGAELRDKILEKLGEEGLDTLESVHVKKAKWENDRIMQGKPVEVSPYDNDPIHLDCHMGKSLDPLFLENATDEEKITLDEHMKGHEASKAQKAMAQMPPPGMAPPPGAAPMPPPPAASEMPQVA